MRTFQFDDACSPEEALERAVIADPHDLTAWSALADYLTERGDPRGEHMQVQRALEGETLDAARRKQLQLRERALRAENEKQWVGDWADTYPAPVETEGRGQLNLTGGEKYEFKRGLLTTVHFGELTVAAARAFVKAPQTRFVRELFIGGHAIEEEFEPGPDIPAYSDAYDGAADHVLFRWPGLRNIRRFQYGWMSDEVYGDFCSFQCHLPGDHVFDFVKQMPDVEEILVFALRREATKLARRLPLPSAAGAAAVPRLDLPAGGVGRQPVPDRS